MRYVTARCISPLALTLGVLSLFACRPETAPTPTAGCVDWQWIAVKSSAERDCPRPVDHGGDADWRAEPLFTSALGTPPPALADFCVYRHAGSGNDSDIPNMVGGPLVSASRDCMAVAPAGVLTESTCDVFKQEFLERIGWIGWEPPIDFGGPSVRLAFLDTMPTEDQGTVKDLDTNSSHGNDLAYLADALICSEDDCAAKITSQLALPCVAVDDEDQCIPDPDKGGSFGFISDLADAIHAEVDAWRASTPRTKLVLNLSLGWDRDLADPDDAVKAVRWAIEDAVCTDGVRENVLVVAAAGNPAGGDPLPDGPLLPAGWEKLEVPCTAGNGAYDPLVHAVGALRFDGYRLALSRPQSRPRLVAFADHWSTSTASETPTAALTGTSVATASVSAIAAAVWDLKPGLAPQEVMQMLHVTGHPIPDVFSEFQLGAEPQPVRRVSLCQAVEGGDDCSDPTKSSLDIAGAPDPNFGQTEDLQSVNQAFEAPDPPPGSPCSASEFFYHQGYQPLNDCPFEELPSIISKPYDWPHPGDDPCPTCGVFPGSGGGGGIAPGLSHGTYTLLIEISDSFPGTLISPTLTVGSRSYSLNLKPMGQGDRAMVGGIPIEAAELAGGGRLDLTWAVDGEGMSAISYLAMMTPPPQDWQLW